MKGIFVAALLLGCVLATTLAQRRSFEFIDSRGQCWRCEPGLPCERCTTRISPRPGLCEKPDCASLPPAERSQLFPSPDLSQFFQCFFDGSAWIVLEKPCPCDQLFDGTGQCVNADELGPIACNAEVITNSRPMPCDADTTPVTPTTTTTTTTTTMSIPTAPTGITTEDPNETTTPNGDTTTSSCTCIIWWPCWCNPCWNFPCGSCNGCMLG